MAEIVSDEFLEYWAKRWRDDSASTPSERAYLEHAGAYEELLQRQKNGQSLEEFVLNVAQRVGAVAPHMRSVLLASLAEIERHTQLVRRVLVGQEP